MTRAVLGRWTENAGLHGVAELSVQSDSALRDHFDVAKWPFIGHNLELLRDSRALVDRMRALHGSVFRIELFGASALIVGEPDLVSLVLDDDSESFSSPRGGAFPVGRLFSPIPLLRDLESHALGRRILRAAFRPEALRSYLATMNPLIAGTLKAWEAGRARELNVHSSLERLTLELAGRALLDLPGERQAPGESSMDDLTRAITIARRERGVLGSRRGEGARRRLARYLEEQLARREGGEGTDMLSELARARAKDGRAYGALELTAPLVAMIAAVREASVRAIGAFIGFLARHRGWQDRLRSESLALGKVSLDWQDRDSCPSMEWAFKESIRLEPPVPFVIRRSTRPVELGDLQLPEDATIGVSAWVTHNLSRLWNRPERFDPERFSPERAEDRRHPHGYFPIGCTHACLGSYFILLQAKAFVHQLLRSYRFTAAAESSRALGFLGGRARSPKVLLEPI